MSVLTVGGTGAKYATLQAAVAASKSGDTIEVNAGTYQAADLQITHDLTIEAAGNGPVNVVASTTNPHASIGKGLFVVGTEGNTPNVTIEGLSFSGAHAGSLNGAGIRYQSGNLTLINDTFHDNDDGILATPFILNTGTIIEQGVTLDHNGVGDGQSHNQYIGLINTFVMKNSVSENANVGHEVKDRAYNSVIENNLITDTSTGNASYGIDLPDGGNAVIQGNTIVKGPNASSGIMIHVGGGEQQNGGTVLIAGNTLVNDYKSPKSTTLVSNQTNNPNLVLQGNTIADGNPGTILNGLGTLTSNVGVGGTVVPNAVSTSYNSATTAKPLDYSSDPAAHTVTVTQHRNLVGGPGHLTVDGTAGNVIVGGSGGITDTGGTMIYTQAQSVNDLTINAGSLVFSAGHDTINILASGAPHVSVSGTATITNHSTHTSAFYVTGNATVHEQGGFFSVYRVLPGGTLNVDGSQQNQELHAQGGTINFNSGVNSGSFSGYVDAGSDKASTMSIMTWDNKLQPNNVKLTSGNYNLTLCGGGNVDASKDSGTITISNSNDAMSFISGSGTARINTGSGAAHIVMGSGNTTVIGMKASPASYYQVAQGLSNGGTMTVNDFKSGVDKLVLDNGVTIASQQVIGGSLHIDTSNNAHLILTGVQHL